MQRFIYILLILAFLGNELFSFEADYAVFQSNEDGYMLVELYLSFYDNILDFEQADIEGTASYSIELKFGNSLTNNRIVKFNSEMVSLYDSTGYRLENLAVNTEKFYAKPSDYNATVYLIQDGKYLDSTSFRMIIRDLEAEFKSNNVAFSDYQFCSIIEPSNDTKWSEKFKKNSFVFIPVPMSQYYGNRENMLAYYEIYFNESLSDNDEKYVITEELLSNTKEIIDFRNQEINGKDRVALISAFSIDSMRTNIYYLRTIIKDTEGREISRSKEQKFYLNNPYMPLVSDRPFLESLSFEKSVFSTMDEEEAAKEFDRINYLLEDKERSVYNQIAGLKGKQRALFSFFSVRDPDTTTTYNEFYEEHKKRTEFADLHFKYGRDVEGWNTPRGRVLLKYGFPTERIEYVRRESKNPTEIWFYSTLQGGIEFYFVDRIGIGNFILVHSTGMNELFNPQWIEHYNPAIPETELQRYQGRSRNVRYGEN
ncbi:MAG: hypothetical protein Kapaf2KO_20420 [Candidatus Kapaibacteriales bacterium]